MSETPRLLAGVHPEIAHLSWLVGEWHGTGVAEFAGQEPFEYACQVEFVNTEQPFLMYQASMWHLTSERTRGELFREESGMWSGGVDNLVTVALATHDGQPDWSGAVQVAEITNAVITRAGLRLVVTDEHGNEVADAGVRSVGIVAEKLLLVHEMGPENHPETDKLSIMMSKA